MCERELTSMSFSMEKRGQIYTPSKVGMWRTLLNVNQALSHTKSYK